MFRIKYLFCSEDFFPNSVKHETIYLDKKLTFLFNTKYLNNKFECEGEQDVMMYSDIDLIIDHAERTTKLAFFSNKTKKCKLGPTKRVK